jgi:hypothetical protein
MTHLNSDAGEYPNPALHLHGRSVVAIDATDPDNFVLVLGALSTHGAKNVAVILTGRCALPPDVIADRLAEGKAKNLMPRDAVPMSEWDRDYSELLKRVSAVRLAKFLTLFGYPDVPLFDGGLAEAPRVPHFLHMEDMKGFGDITDSVEAAVREGSLQPLRPLNTFSSWAQDSPFVVYLGGPATGIAQLLEEPCQRSCVTGIFAQYGVYGDEKVMAMEGRGERVQFNVWLDIAAGARLVDICKKYGVPFYFLPSNVTRRAEIGLGIPALGEGVLDSRHVGFLELQRMRTIWYKNAIAPRAGELLLDHDMACLVMYLQTMGEILPAYEVHRVVPKIVTIESPAVKAGETHFTFEGEGVATSPFWLATKLLNRDVYFEVLNQTIRFADARTNSQVVLSTSLSPSDMADDTLLREYEARLIELLLPRLRAGDTIHWGSHPSTARVMARLAELYPNQLCQHLLKRLSQSRIGAIPAENVRMYESLNDLIAGMIPNKDEGLFLAGRLDLENTEMNRSGVLAEYRLFSLCNPLAKGTLDASLGGYTAMIQIGKALDRLAATYPTVESFMSVPA